MRRRPGKSRAHPDSKKKAASQYISRTQAVRKLQISLKDFRRLCILKGIFPRDPKKKKVKSGNRTYYFTKDIAYLAHEPILNKFREFKIFLKRYAKALGRDEKPTQTRLKRKRPTFQLDHLVKERYPTFEDALNDIDDALSMIYLFAMLPRTDRIPAHRTRNCKRLANEFQAWAAHESALKKVFVSVKGVYYQASVLGKNVTWLVPHKFSQEMPSDVDYNVMLTFLEFYEVLLHFVNLRLYKNSGLFYPPEMDPDRDEAGLGVAALILKPAGPTQTVSESVAEPQPDASTEAPDAQVTERLKTVENVIESLVDRDAEMNSGDESAAAEEDEGALETSVFGLEPSSLQNTRDFNPVFRDCVIYLSREIPREALEFVIRSRGGTVTWEGETAPIPVDSPRITHMIVDRPTQQHMFLDREYCQPQWVFDSFNCGCLLPCHEYAPGATLPAHLSPFVKDEDEGYIPERAKQLKRYVAAAQGEPIESEEEAVEEAQDGAASGENNAEQESEESGEEDEDEDEEGDEADESDEDEESESEAQSKQPAKKAKRTPVPSPNPDGRSKEEMRYLAELEAEKKGLGYSEHLKQASSAEAVSLSKEKRRKLQEEEEQKQLAVNMMSKRQKRLYDRGMFGKQRKQDQADKLKTKAKMLKSKS